MDDAKKIHSKYPLIDGHNDLPFALRTCFDMKWSKLDLRKDWTNFKIERGCPWQCLHTDIPRLRKGGIGGQFWSVFVPTIISKGLPIDPATAIAFT
jgi:membrane dipeptidase